MAKITLVTLSLSVELKGKNTDKQQDTLDSFDVVCKDNFDLYSILVDKIKKGIQKTNEDKKKVFEFSTVKHDRKKRLIYGKILAGEYGFEADLYHTQKKKRRKRDVNEAELVPYYFMLHLPEGNAPGFLLLQRFQNNGVKTIFYDFLSEIIEENIPLYRLRMNNIIPKDIYDSIIDRSEIKEIRFTKYYAESSSSDDVDNLVKTDDTIQMEKIGYTQEIKYKLHSKERRLSSIVKGLIKKSISGEDIIQSLVEELSDNKDSDEISVVVEDGNVSRTIMLYDKQEIKLEYNNRMFPYFDISDEVEYDKSGHPMFDSINEVARKYLNIMLGREV